MTTTLFAMFMIGVLSSLIFAALIDTALAKRHPEERNEVRLNLFSIYRRYAWQQRGRSLGDDQLTKLLDRYRLVQIAIYVTFVLVAVSAYVGV